MSWDGNWKMVQELQTQRKDALFLAVLLKWDCKVFTLEKKVRVSDKVAHIDRMLKDLKVTIKQ